MNKYTRLAVVVLTACTYIATVWLPCNAAANDNAVSGAKTEIQGSVLAVRSEIRSLTSQIRQLQDQLDVAQKQQEIAKARVNSGVASIDELLPWDLKLKQLREQISERTSMLADARRLAALAEPVDIVLKSASIRQAVEALSRVTSLKITVDSRVSNNIRVKTQARGVPLGAILEVIANATQISIAPGKDGELLLRLPGKLMLNEKVVSYQGPNQPWSDEWSTVDDGALYCPIGRRWLNLFGAVRYQIPMPVIVPTDR